MKITKNNKTYSFTPNNDWLEHFKINQTVTQNDIYESHDITVEMTGRLLVCNDKSKMKQFCNKIISETYEEYQNFILEYDKADNSEKRDKWIYNILDGISEQEQIIYSDESVIILPNYRWNGIDMNKLHILVIPRNKSLRSIRSLDSSHVELLEHCKSTASEIIKSIYDVDSSSLKMFFHYAPTTWHLHIHCVHINNNESNSSVEYCHELSSVIYNLSICSDYYKNVLNKRI